MTFLQMYLFYLGIAVTQKYYIKPAIYGTKT